MRCRPKLEVRAHPQVARPGEEIRVEAVLRSKSETPVDFVSIVLRGTIRVTLGSGNEAQTHTRQFYGYEWRSGETTLAPGERRFTAAFRLPDDAPPMYTSSVAIVTYTLGVRVSIPWWPDREGEYVLNVARPPMDAPPAAPRVFATSLDGPVGKEPFIELALDDTWLTAGTALSGSVSFQNLRGRRIKNVSVALVEVETIALPYATTRESRSWGLRIFDGMPQENEPIRFALRVPAEAYPAIRTSAFTMTTFVEARASVAWGSDLVIRVPIEVAPLGSTVRNKGRRVAPIGREHRAVVWAAIAGRSALVFDADNERLHGMRGRVAVEIRNEQRADGPVAVAELRYPPLGVDLEIRERSWTDALAANLVKSGHTKADARLGAHAREHDQAAPVVACLAPALVAFDDVRADDAIAVVSTAGSLHTARALDSFVAAVFALADALDAARALIVAPFVFRDHVDAWRLFAEHLGGRLRLGDMSIRGGRIGTDAVELGAEFSAKGVLLGTGARVAIDPPLGTLPASVEDPALSPAARDAWRSLVEHVPDMRLAPDAIELRFEGKTADPATLLPTLEIAVKLRRALVGAAGAGPFR